MVADAYGLCLSTIGPNTNGQPVGLAKCKNTPSKIWSVKPQEHWQNGNCKYDR